MRFSELRLLKYGHFESCTLVFPSGEPDLQFVYGPNEAGKTTTLSAIRDLLFGFGHRTSQDYRFDRSLLRVGAVLSGEGGDLSVRRRKGEVRTLLDDSDAPLPDDTLVPHLHGYDADAFERMFSLDHARLRQGGGEIVAGEGAVGEAIFSAGAGLSGIVRLCDELDAEAKGIWTRNKAQGRLYYVAQEAHDAAKARLREALVKPAKWDTARRDFERAAAAVAEAQAEFERLLAEQAANERRRRLVLPVAQLLERRRSLAELGAVPELPADAAETCRSCLAEIETARVRRQVAAEQGEAARAELAGLEVPEALVSVADAVAALRDRRSVISGYVSDLPRRRATRDADLSRLRVLQADLEWPAESAAEMRDRLPVRARTAELRELVEARGRLDERLAAAARAETMATEQATQLARRYQALGAAVDVSAAAVTSRRLRTAAGAEASTDRLRRTVAQLETQLSSSMARLAPWSGPVDALRELAVPGEREVAAASEALERTGREVERAEDAVADAQARVEAAALELHQEIETGAPVLPEAVLEARRARDGVWAGLRSALLDGTPLQEPATGVARYEAEVVAADRLSDRRTDTSEAAALAIARRRDLEIAELALQQAQARCVDAERRRSEAQGAWRALVGAVGPDLDVPAFQAWRARSEDALAIADRLVTANDDLRQAEAASRDAVAEAQTLSAGLRVEPGQRSLASVLDDVDARIGAITAANAERTALERQVEAAEGAVTRSRAELTEARDELAAWETAWTERVSQANLGQGASFSLVKDRLALLDEVREITGSIVDLERRIGSMEQEVATFAVEVDAVADGAGVRLPDGGDCVARLAALQAALDAGEVKARRRAELSQALEAAAAASAAADAEMRTAEACLRPLMDLAGVTLSRDLAPLVELSARALALAGEIGKLEDQVLVAGGGGTVADLVELVRALDPDQLAAESERIGRAMDDLRTRLQQLSEEKQRTEALFRQIDDGPDAAAAEADLVQARAEMEFQAEVYVERRAEALLLRWAMERFRRERQAPLLRSASAIFSRLTLGRYVGLDVAVEGKSVQLIGLLADGSRTVPARAMSDGTADQLYLALRIAAVREAVDGGARLPFVADDLFINYDDERAAAGFRELAELARVTQVLFLTHHEHLLEVAAAAVAPLRVSSCTLGPPALAGAREEAA